MKCVVCGSAVAEVLHIAIDKKGDPQVLCGECHAKVRIFFEEVKRGGKAKS